MCKDHRCRRTITSSVICFCTSLPHQLYPNILQRVL
uniref:Chaperonin 60 subunit beta 4ic isoform X2 n=1 Tax=Rhizophora mucronata TaxID=61149 RepID=A0A2P2LEK2_RHIMU